MKIKVIIEKLSWIDWSIGASAHKFHVIIDKQGGVSQLTGEVVQPL